MKFSNLSLEKLKGVHPSLVSVALKAIEITEQDFKITCGVRSLEEQKVLVNKGKSKTLNSKHLKQKDGYGHAVDVVDYPVTWNIENFYPIAKAFQTAAKELNVKIRWGGCWKVLNDMGDPKEAVETYSKERKSKGLKVFIDAPHFELYFD